MMLSIPEEENKIHRSHCNDEPAQAEGDSRSRLFSAYSSLGCKESRHFREPLLPDALIIWGFKRQTWHHDMTWNIDSPLAPGAT
jgi:hypothetical protein